MAEIIISNAPPRYQPYLKQADEGSYDDSHCQKDNGKIDCEPEARTRGGRILKERRPLPRSTFPE